MEAFPNAFSVDKPNKDIHNFIGNFTPLTSVASVRTRFRLVFAIAHRRNQ